jgi:hypothetical protein
MKIYDKRKFGFGVMYVLLGVCILILGFLKEFDVKGIILSILTPSIGMSEIYVSMNRKALKKERFEKTEERNQLIELTSASKAFKITREICFTAMLICFGVGSRLDDSLFMGIGIGFAISFYIMIFLDLFSTIYYEEHM